MPQYIKQHCHLGHPQATPQNRYLSARQPSCRPPVHAARSSAQLAKES